MPSLRELMSYQSPGAIHLCGPYSPSVTFRVKSVKARPAGDDVRSIGNVIDIGAKR